MHPRALRLRAERIAGLAGADSPELGAGYCTEVEAAQIVDAFISDLGLHEDIEKALTLGEFMRRMKFPLLPAEQAQLEARRRAAEGRPQRHDPRIAAIIAKIDAGTALAKGGAR